MSSPRISVVVPVFDQAAFLPRALASLAAQEVDGVQVVVVDDGSPEPVAGADIRFERNEGLGRALNAGLDAARAPAVAYLPADDLLLPGHLDSLLAALDSGASFAWAEREGGPPTPWLQLAQVAHRLTDARWVERTELESDDLERIGWSVLRPGEAVGTGQVTCRWEQHPAQRHRLFRAAEDGGLNVFRSRYRPGVPLRFAPAEGGAVDEPARYAFLAGRPRSEPDPAEASILLAGELAYNPERIVLLAERGHRLRGLWTDQPLGFMTVGPLPFGGVAEVGRRSWRDELRADPPDVIYGLLNWRALGLLDALQDELAGRVGFVVHFKEAPQRAIARGEWPLLARVATRADALVLATLEEREWFHAALPGVLDPGRTHVLDGDPPLAHWLDSSPRAPRLGEQDGAIHTVLAGRPYGMRPELPAELARRGVHLHVHAPALPPDWAPGPHLHHHEPIEPSRWVEVLSRYDAGWLHPHVSANHGDVRRALWDDLNLPARVPTYLAAGLALIGSANPEHTVATERIIRDTGAGVLLAGGDLDALDDRPALAAARDRAWAVRRDFTFDAVVDDLRAILRDAAGATHRPGAC